MDSERELPAAPAAMGPSRCNLPRPAGRWPARPPCLSAAAARRPAAAPGDNLLNHLKTKKTYSEKDVAQIARALVSSVAYCHHNGADGRRGPWPSPAFSLPHLPG